MAKLNLEGIKQHGTRIFSELRRGSPFIAHLTVYSKSNHEESPQDHLFYKMGKNKAVTTDRRVMVYFASNDNVIACSW